MKIARASVAGDFDTWTIFTDVSNATEYNNMQRKRQNF